ncbi:MAG TPA: HAD-IC family P-type ATPase, partial [Bdellovibrionota bacterium]|nr:HAD-IC family P-type ATPase [Bdellovibrionota bacterium]
RRLSTLNSSLQTGLANPLDQAILQGGKPDLSAVRKLDEIPYDFIRKRLSVIVDDHGSPLLITKGAFSQVLATCTTLPDGKTLDAASGTRIEERFTQWAQQGVRVLAVATRAVPKKDIYVRDDEHDMVFRGFLTFIDQPKKGVTETLAHLKSLGVSVKLITGDSGLVARHVAKSVGLGTDHVLTGKDLEELRDEGLWRIAESTDLFVEVDPNQKERIIRALKTMGHVVGFMGDGINDVPAMHAADTSLSVEHAVDVARDAADFILLKRNLDVIRRGIQEGRHTFANTLKYILTTTSANLGNMLSMAVASLFLPFLPLLAGQVLLNNFLSDIPAIGLANDRVDPELVARPGRWDMRFIGRFMVEFGLLSSVFDFFTFAVLLWGFRAPPTEFRTGWFVESLLTELAIALVVRTRRPFYRSRPSPLLWQLSVAVGAVAVALPYVPRAALLGFVPLPPGILAAIGVITAGYVLTTELAKRRFRW